MSKTGKRERNKVANRGAILDAARQCFLERGYDAVTIRDVVRQSGLAAGTFYNYFRTKEELLRALIESRVAQVTAQLVELRRRARNLQQFLEGAYLAGFRTVADEPVLYNLMLRNEPAVRALYKDSVLGVSVRALKDDLRDGMNRGIIPRMDVDALAAALFGAGYELGRLLAENPGRDPEATAAFATRLFVGGIQAFASNAPLKPRVRTAG
ncbi:MAG TPA: helix-turn-helix domain-containing protein [Candidatus Binatia bacterium]|nr:helix-turn-helix domain-containing protein [Candidatus Binatia bacterium]